VKFINAPFFVNGVRTLAHVIIVDFDFTQVVLFRGIVASIVIQANDDFYSDWFQQTCFSF
jgi:hypothetical protein